MTRNSHGIFGTLVIETLAMQESTSEMKVNFGLLLQFLLFLVLVLLRDNRRRMRQYFNCVNENTGFDLFMMCESILVILNTYVSDSTLSFLHKEEYITE